MNSEKSTLCDSQNSRAPHAACRRKINKTRRKSWSGRKTLHRWPLMALKNLAHGAWNNFFEKKKRRQKCWKSRLCSVRGIRCWCTKSKWRRSAKICTHRYRRKPRGGNHVHARTQHRCIQHILGKYITYFVVCSGESPRRRLRWVCWPHVAGAHRCRNQRDDRRRRPGIRAHRRKRGRLSANSPRVVTF